MTIVNLKTHPTAHWKQTILDHYPFPPYWWIRGITTESRQSLMNLELDKVLTAEKACLLGYVSDEGELLGFAQMHWLEWDTNHFGYNIWRLDRLGMWDGSSRRWAIAEALIQEGVRITREQGCQGIYARISIDNLPAIHALEIAGFRTVEILTTWIFDFANSSIPPKRNPDLVRDFRPADLEALIELARTAYAPTPDRFHVDPHLSSKASNELRAEWIRNSVSGQLADHIAVAVSDGEAVGYSTMKYFGDHEGRCNARIAQLGLGAVQPNCGSRGLGTDVVIHHMEWLNRRQADFCIVGTQGNNIPPQRVWLKIGFKPATMVLTLHYWEGKHHGAGTQPAD